MEPQTIQQATEATDKLIPIIAAFFVAFTGLIKLWAEIYKIKRDRLKTKAEREKHFQKIEQKIGLDTSEEDAEG